MDGGRTVRHKQHTVCKLPPCGLHMHNNSKRQAGCLEKAGMFVRISGVK